jgi:hypothetical protein
VTTTLLLCISTRQSNLDDNDARLRKLLIYLTSSLDSKGNVVADRIKWSIHKNNFRPTGCEQGIPNEN